MLEKALRYIVLTGVFALPFLVLYVSTSLFFPFITGKNFAFRIIIEIILGAWVALAHLFAYFVVAVSVLNTERLWKYWWHTTLSVSVIVAFIGLLQLAGKVPINQGGARIDARIGNATYLGVYMLFHIFMAG